MDKRGKITLSVLIVSIILIGFFSLYFVLAQTDNILTYSKNDLKVDFEDEFSNYLGSAELKSHSNVDEVVIVPDGDNIPVMYYDFNFNNEYIDGLGDVFFTNENTGKVENKEYYFAKARYELQMSYHDDCIDPMNWSTCVRIETGLYKNFNGWDKLENNSIPKGESRIALITDVSSGDEYDGVWTIVGEKILKHAKWTEESLITDLWMGLPMNQSAGSIVIDVFETRNATTFNMEDADWSSNCVSGNCLNFDGGDEYINLSYVGGFANHAAFTYSYWVNTTDSEPFYGIIGGNNAGANPVFQVQTEYGTADGRHLITFNTAAGSLTARFTNVTVNDGNFHLITYTIKPDDDIVVVRFDGRNHTITYSSQTTPGKTALLNPLGLCALIGDPNHQSDSQNCPNNLSLDEFYIWNRSLTDIEVLDMYDTRGGFTDNFDTTNFTVTFNLTDSITNVTLPLPGNDEISITCGSTWSSGLTGTNPITSATDVFPSGTHSCDFTADRHFSKSLNISVTQNETIVIPMSADDGLTQEEHDWLEAVYDCVINNVGCSAHF